MSEFENTSIDRPLGLCLSLQTSMFLATFVTVLLTAIAVYTPWYLTSRSDISMMAKRLDHEVVSVVKRQVGNLFDTAIYDQRMLAGVIESGMLDFSSDAERDALFVSFMKSKPFYSFVGLGLQSGDYYGAYRADQSRLAGITSIWDKNTEKASRSERMFVGDGKMFVPTGAITLSANNYYSPDRVWYGLAMDNPGQDVVTDPYLFSNTRTPGVNTALAIKNNHGIEGVVTIALELERLSAFMRTLSISKSGIAVVLNKDGRLVASSQYTEQGVGKTAGADAPGGDVLSMIGDQSDGRLKLLQSVISKGQVSIKNLTGTLEIETEDEAGAYFLSFSPLGYHNWVVATVIPENDLTGGVAESHRKMLVMLLLATLVTGLLSMVLVRKFLLQPITRIIGQLHLVEKFDLKSVSVQKSRIVEINELGSAIVKMSHSLGSFGKYLPVNLVKTLFSNGVNAELSGERRTMTILFMDLAGFTTITEALGPRLLPALGQYFSGMSDAIQETGGTIDKYIGDAVMAFWGAPSHLEEHATLACRAALDCLRELEVLRADWPDEWKDKLSVRIGVNSGRVVVGNIGSSSRLNYTVIGDPVNLASRFEGTCKEFGVNCIIGQSTYDLAKYDIVARHIGQTVVKGHIEPVDIYELLAMADNANVAEEFAWLPAYEQGYKAFRDHDWDVARKAFLRVIEIKGEDMPTRLLLDACNGIS